MIGDLSAVSEGLVLRLLFMLFKALKLTPALVLKFRASGHDVVLKYGREFPFAAVVLQWLRHLIRAVAGRALEGMDVYAGLSGLPKAECA